MRHTGTGPQRLVTPAVGQAVRAKEGMIEILLNGIKTKALWDSGALRTLRTKLIRADTNNPTRLPTGTQRCSNGSLSVCHIFFLFFVQLHTKNESHCDLPSQVTDNL
eukprot:Selendium_serpulae@DN1961_c0_g1_i1.p1